MQTMRGERPWPERRKVEQWHTENCDAMSFKVACGCCVCSWLVLRWFAVAPVVVPWEAAGDPEQLQGQREPTTQEPQIATEEIVSRHKTNHEQPQAATGRHEQARTATTSHRINDERPQVVMSNHKQSQKQPRPATSSRKQTLLSTGATRSATGANAAETTGQI